MHANLMRPAGARLNTAQREAPEAFDDLVKAARLLAVFLVVGDGHLDAVARMMADPPFDVIAVAVEHAGRDGDVFLEDFAVLELQAHIAMRHLVLGYENDAAGVAVQAVDDAGPVIPAEPAELPEM